MIQIVRLSANNFLPDALDQFQRTQEVRNEYRMENGVLRLVPCMYIADWDPAKKRAVAEELCSDAYITYLALDEDLVVGFIGLLRALAGSYMILDNMQVSAPYRGMGIGRKLFMEGKEAARKAGAQALYISACPALETIAFYQAMGATVTEHPIREIAEAEPFDLQMVCDVTE